MADELHDDAAREDRLDEVIASYLEAAERGEAPDAQAYVAQHPDIAAELSLFFADRAEFQQVAGELSPAAKRSTASLAAKPASDPNEPTLGFDEGAAASATGPRRTVRYLGDYELIDEIARCGMGVVYKARQVSLDRIVALKMILAGQLATPEDVKRFRVEADAAAQLDHPNIVPIHEVGEHEGQQYFSMGYVDGQSLAARLAEGPLPPREAAEMVKTVTDAVEYAHEKGIIHRDLKPSNILLDSQGQPRVTDFGLAKRLEADSNVTQSGQILGTPSYMPPEEATANTIPDRRIDNGDGALPALGRLNRYAVEAWEKAVQPDLDVRLGRADSLARAGDHAAAAAEAATLAKIPELGGYYRYQLARVLALSAQAVRRDIALAEAYGGKAMNLLERARTAGWLNDARNVVALSQDADLSFLRDRDDFRKLVAMAIDDGTEAIRLKKDPSRGFERRGELFAKNNEPAKASDDFARLYELVPDNVLVAQKWCYTLTGSGNVAGYRAACVRLRDRFGMSDDPNQVLVLCRILILSPEAVTDKEFLVQLGQKAVRLDQGSWWARHALAGAYIRNDQYEEALSTLDEMDVLP